ncbi:MAG: hypothetical protein ACXVRP_13320, partial [Solirubrobacteraceae bacterium]
MMVDAMWRRRRDVLKLDGAAGGDHRGRQEGDDVTARERADSRDSARPRQAAGGGRGGGCGRRRRSA